MYYKIWLLLNSTLFALVFIVCYITGVSILASVFISSFLTVLVNAYHIKNSD